MAQGKDLDELNRLYDKAEEVDREVFAEMRSNLLLVSGNHYQKGRRGNPNTRANLPSTQSLQEQKLRLTKNHMHRVSRMYVTAILAEAPDTAIRPKHDTELQDKKEAELNSSVWHDVKDKYKIAEKRSKWAKSFVDVGEVCTKIFWDPMAGDFKGYEQKVDEKTGEPVMEPTDEIDPMTGEPVMGPVVDEEKPVFTGGFVFEDVEGFNLLREPSAQAMGEQGMCWIVRKMVDTDTLKRRYKNDPDVVKSIETTDRETYVVFDSNKGTYEKSKDQTLVREFYWDVCEEFPQGWFCFATKAKKLEEGPLPKGIFPLIWAGFDKYPTAPRGRSILKVARPYQGEINRASSKIAEAQVTLGDDKILYQAGTKLAPGALLPGVRGLSYQGQIPTVLPGRDGSQYLPYVEAQIQELEQALMLGEMEVTNASGQLDPYALLFKAASKKMKYSPYIETFERYQKEVTFLVLELAKYYYPDDILIPAVGRREIINIAEFRATNPLCYEIEIEPQTETLETQFGRMLTFQNLIQYAGGSIDKRTLGKLVRNLPYANWKDSFDDLTIDEDIAENDMLALERGKPVQATQYADPTFMLQKLTVRMKKPEFQTLPDPVKQNYQTLVTQYEQINAQQQQQLIDAKNEYIPMDGTLVTLDMYVEPKSPDEQAKRAKLPQHALEWLMQRLQAQGASQDKLETMNAQALSEMANMILKQKATAGQNPTGSNPMSPVAQMQMGSNPMMQGRH